MIYKKETQNYLEGIQYNCFLKVALHCVCGDPQKLKENASLT